MWDIRGLCIPGTMLNLLRMADAMVISGPESYRYTYCCDAVVIHHSTTPQENVSEGFHGTWKRKFTSGTAQLIKAIIDGPSVVTINKSDI